MLRFQALSHLPSGFILGRRMDSCVSWFHHWAQFNAILWFCLLSLSFWSYFRNESKTDLCLKKSCSFIQYLKQCYNFFLIVEEKASFLFICSKTSALLGNTYFNTFNFVFIIFKIYIWLCTYWNNQKFLSPFWIIQVFLSWQWKLSSNEEIRAH